ncbi:DUF1073 domain-containing protein [Novosphingobium olei]|nr:DUF1073 domain-containing protein [Novosphingobium olei]
MTRLFDGLRNAITGQGTGRDPRSASTYVSAPLTQQQVEAAYRGSGLLRKIIQISALDMVREWRDWSGLDDDQAAAIWDEEKRLGLREKIKEVETLRGLGGGALILGLPGDPSQPAPRQIGTGGLAFVNVVSRWHLAFDTLQDDARKPDFGEPVMWRLNTAAGGQQEIHPSRVITFRADTSATLISVSTNSADAYWGESRLAQVLDAVKDSDAARGAFASLLHKARLTRVGIPNLTDLVSTADGEKALSSRLGTIALAESMFNVAIYDAGNGDGPAEKIDDVAYNFAGAKDILNAFAEFVSAISDIPATRLLGRAPEGMNASGDSQQRDWSKKVRAMQTLDLGPCLDRLDTYLVPSALGATQLDASYAFAPLDVETDKERADRFYTQMQAAEKLAGLNAMPEEAFNRGVQSLMIAEGYLPELESALSEIPEDERYGISPDPSLGDPNADPSAPKGGDPVISAPGGSSNGPLAAANDAAPRTLYVQRKLLNAGELIDWAKAQGFETTAPADQLHVTVAYSRQPVDWMKVGQDWHGDETGKLTVPAGGARLVEPLGDKRAVVLLFSSSALSWRHEAIKEAGASFDFEQYQPHVTITYNAPEGLDLASVEPYRGKLEFGPEIFEEINEGWASNLEEA